MALTLDDIEARKAELRKRIASSSSTNDGNVSEQTHTTSGISTKSNSILDDIEARKAELRKKISKSEKGIENTIDTTAKTTKNTAIKEEPSLTEYDFTKSFGLDLEPKAEDKPLSTDEDKKEWMLYTPTEEEKAKAKEKENKKQERQDLFDSISTMNYEEVSSHKEALLQKAAERKEKRKKEELDKEAKNSLVSNIASAAMMSNGAMQPVAPKQSDAVEEMPLELFLNDEELEEMAALDDRGAVFSADLRKRAEDDATQSEEIVANIEVLLGDDKGINAARNLNGARYLNEKAREILNAGSKFDESKGIKNWWQGTKDNLDRDLLSTMQLSRQLRLNDIIKRYDPDNPDSVSQDEYALLMSYINLLGALEARQYDLSMGYTIGKGSAQSIPFMVDMVVTKGAGALLKKGIVKGVAKGLSRAGVNAAKAATAVARTEKFLGTKPIASGAATLADGTASRLAAGGVIRQGAKKAARDVVYEAGATVAQTALMPTAWSIMKKGENDYMLNHNVQDVDLKHKSRFFTDALVETLTERAGGKAIDWAFGKVLGEVRKVLPKGMDLSGRTRTAATSYIQSPIGETGEEYLVAMINYLRSYNPNFSEEENKHLRGEVQQMFSKEGFLTTAGTVLPMSLFGGGVNMYNVHRADKNYQQSRQNLMSIIQERMGYDSKTADELLSYVEQADNVVEFANRVNTLGLNLDMDAIIERSQQGDETADSNTEGNTEGNTENKPPREKTQTELAIEDYIEKATAYNSMVEDFKNEYKNLTEVERKNMQLSMARMEQDAFANTISHIGDSKQIINASVNIDGAQVDGYIVGDGRLTLHSDNTINLDETEDVLSFKYLDPTDGKIKVAQVSARDITINEAPIATKEYAQALYNERLAEIEQQRLIEEALRTQQEQGNAPTNNRELTSVSEQSNIQNGRTLAKGDTFTRTFADGTAERVQIVDVRRREAGRTRDNNGNIAIQYATDENGNALYDIVFDKPIEWAMSGGNGEIHTTYTNIMPYEQFAEAHGLFGYQLDGGNSVELVNGSALENNTEEENAQAPTQESTTEDTQEGIQVSVQVENQQEEPTTETQAAQEENTEESKEEEKDELLITDARYKVGDKFYSPNGNPITVTDVFMADGGRIGFTIDRQINHRGGLHETFYLDQLEEALRGEGYNVPETTETTETANVEEEEVGDTLPELTGNEVLLEGNEDGTGIAPTAPTNNTTTTKENAPTETGGATPTAATTETAPQTPTEETGATPTAATEGAEDGAEDGATGTAPQAPTEAAPQAPTGAAQETQVNIPQEDIDAAESALAAVNHSKMRKGGRLFSNAKYKPIVDLINKYVPITINSKGAKVDAREMGYTWIAPISGETIDGERYYLMFEYRKPSKGGEFVLEEIKLLDTVNETATNLMMYETDKGNVLNVGTVPAADAFSKPQLEEIVTRINNAMNITPTTETAAAEQAAAEETIGAEEVGEIPIAQETQTATTATAETDENTEVEGAAENAPQASETATAVPTAAVVQPNNVKVGDTFTNEEGHTISVTRLMDAEGGVTIAELSEPIAFRGTTSNYISSGWLNGAMENNGYTSNNTTQQEEKPQQETIDYPQTRKKDPLIAADGVADHSSTKTKWDKAKKLDGFEHTRVLNRPIKLADGTEITEIPGHFVVVEEGSATPSHNPNDKWRSSEGFPVNENGLNANNRDYHSDEAAQAETYTQSQHYNGQAVTNTPMVTRDGIVLDGNGRVMAGILAAERTNATDDAYIRNLIANASNFGFISQEQKDEIASMSHPRVYFVPDIDIPYTMHNFAVFNAEDKKYMGSREFAKSIGRQLNEPQNLDKKNEILSIIGQYATIDSFFREAGTEKQDRVVKLLHECIGSLGINLTTANKYVEANATKGQVFTYEGRSLVQYAVIGSVFDEHTADMIFAVPSIKQTVTGILPQIAKNLALGENFTLQNEINDAIKLLYEKRQTINSADSFDAFIQQSTLEVQDVLDEKGNSTGETEFVQNAIKNKAPITLIIAKGLCEDISVTRDILKKYNESANSEKNNSNGIFAARSKADIVNAAINDYAKTKLETYENAHTNLVRLGNVGNHRGQNASYSNLTNAARHFAALLNLGTINTSDSKWDILGNGEAIFPMHFRGSNTDGTLVEHTIEYRYAKNEKGDYELQVITLDNSLNEDKSNAILYKNSKGEWVINGETETKINTPPTGEMIADAIVYVSSTTENAIEKRDIPKVMFQTAMEQADFGKTKQSMVATSAVVSALQESGISVEYITQEEAIAEFQGQSQELATPQGKVYGYVKNGVIYLTEDGLNPETPIHEYTHLWVESIKEQNAQLYESLQALFGREAIPNMWEEIDNNPDYAHLSDEAKLSEIIAQFSGARGAQRMATQAQAIIDQSDKGSKKSISKARALINSMQKLLEDFWNWVGVNLLHIKSFGSIEEAADRALYDLMVGTPLSVSNSTNSQFQTSSRRRRLTKAQAAQAYRDYLNNVKDEEFKAEYTHSLERLKRLRDAQYAIIDQFKPIENLYNLIREKGGVYYRSMDAYLDSFCVQGRVATQLADFEHNQLTEMAKCVRFILNDPNAKKLFENLQLNWVEVNRDYNPIEVNGIRSIGDEIDFQRFISLYLQAKDVIESEQKNAEKIADALNEYVNQYNDAPFTINKGVDGIYHVIIGVDTFDLTAHQLVELSRKPIEGAEKKTLIELLNYRIDKNNGEPFLSKNAIIPDRGYDDFARAIVQRSDNSNRITPEWIVNEFENMFTDGVNSQAISNLHKSVQNATLFSLNLLKNNDMITEESYNTYTERNWYVPERGWEARNNVNIFDDGIVYGTIFSRPTSPKNTALKKAEGRGTLAADPFQYIYSIAHSTIQEVERNKNKKMFLEFLRANARIADAGEIWKPQYAYVDKNGNIVYAANIQEAADKTGYDAKDLRQIKQDIKRFSNRTQDEVEQHYLEVNEGGYITTIYLPDTKLANALNHNFGETRSWLNNRAGNTLRAASRWISSMSTRYNPAFAVWNLIRDVQVAYINNLARDGENAKDAAKSLALFTKNLAATQGALNKYLAADFSEEEFKADSEMDKLLQEYFANGAQTGWSFMSDIHEYKDTWDEMVNGRSKAKTISKTAKSILAYGTEWSELTVRFAEYATARQLGYTPQQAADKAKEISTNFDRRGSSSGGWNALYAFFNATIQGSWNIIRSLKNPRALLAYSLAAGAYMGLGYLNTMLMPDEPGVRRFGDYTRRQNFIVGDNHILPVAHFWRMFYGIGVEMALSSDNKDYGFVHTKKQGHWEMAKCVLDEIIPSSAAQLHHFFDYDYQTNTINADVEGFIQAFMPTAVRPIVDVGLNRDFAGRTIWKETYLNEDENLVTDLSTAKNRTPRLYVDMAKGINELTGGIVGLRRSKVDPNTRGSIDISPAAMHYLVNGYLGGLGNTLFDGMSMITDIVHTGTVDPKNIPIYNRSYRSYDIGADFSSRYYDLANKANPRVKYGNELRDGLFDLTATEELQAREYLNSDVYRTSKEANKIVNKYARLNKHKEAITDIDVDYLKNTDKEMIKAINEEEEKADKE